MNEEKEIYEEFMEILALLYILEIALGNEAQSTNDLNPYAYFVKLIKHKITNLADSIETI